MSNYTTVIYQTSLGTKSPQMDSKNANTYQSVAELTEKKVKIIAIFTS